MKKLTDAIKKSMIDNGRTDFNKYLAEILNCTPQNASFKLNGRVAIKDIELSMIIKALNMPDDEILKAIKEEC